MATARKLAATLLIAAAAAGCGSGGNTNVARHSPSPSAASSPLPTPSQTPRPVTGAYGVLYSSQAASTYTVSIVGIDGRVVASVDASTPPITTCANAAGAPVPAPVSSSDSRVYYMDAQGAVRTLSVDGSKQDLGISLGAQTSSRRAMFAVSPDDAMIAVVVDDYTASGASTKLFVNQLQLGAQTQIFSETGSRTLWPIGWHGPTNLVVAVVPSCTQGGGPFCCGVQELHVIDPANATRRFTLGAVTSCPIVGSPSPAGAICWDGTNSRVLNWTAGTVRTYPMPGPEIQLLSPDGNRVALVDNTGTSVQASNVAWHGMFACTWMDGEHLLSGGDPQHQPRIGEVPSGVVKPVAAQGDCAGRLPGGL